MKTWTKTLAVIGQIIGMMTGMSPPYYYGLNSIADFAYLLGVGMPFAIIGLLVGLGIDYFVKPVEEKKVSDEKITTKNYAVGKTDEIKNKNISITTEKIYDSMEYAYSQVPVENKTNEKKIETAKLITTNINEEKIWEIVADEFDSDKRKKGLYAKLFAETSGDEVAIKAMYYKARVKELINENSNTAIERERR